MARTTCLVTVVVGEVYARFASAMFTSAERYFRPTERLRTIILPGVSGWPQATMMRPRILADWLRSPSAEECDYVFLVDADARFEAEVGAEVLSEGVTATLHPGYVGKPVSELPYERRPESSCAVLNGHGGSYYCGGFVGGRREAVLSLMERSAGLIERDLQIGRVPRWHDESAHNCVFAASPPARILSPAYAHPDDDSWYLSWWPEPFERRIVMLDKTAAQRIGRERE